MVRKYYTRKKTIARISKTQAKSIKRVRDALKGFTKKEVRNIAEGARDYRRRYYGK